MIIDEIMVVQKLDMQKQTRVFVIKLDVKYDSQLSTITNLWKLDD